MRGGGIKQHHYKRVNMQKGCFSSLIVQSFGPQKVVIRATSHVHNTLNGDQNCLLIIQLVAMQFDPYMDILGTQAAPKQPCLAIFHIF